MYIPMQRQGATRRKWCPNWKIWTFSLILLPVLCGLGVWQFDRGREKEALLQQWRTQTEQPLAALRAPRWGQPLRASGRYDRHFQWLLDNRTRDGQPGYEVLDLFHAEDGQSLVVNRGWVPAPGSRSILPAITTPSGAVTIRARVAGYPEPPMLGGRRAEAGWPKRVQALKPEDVRDQTGRAAAYVVRLEDADQPGAFRVDWPILRMGPARHFGYSVQWFLMALVLLGMTIWVSFRKVSDDDECE